MAMHWSTPEEMTAYVETALEEHQGAGVARLAHAHGRIELEQGEAIGLVKRR